MSSRKRPPGAAARQPPARRAGEPVFWGQCLVLCALVVIGFFPALQCGFVGLDDGGYVTHNRHVQAGLVPESIGWAFTATAQSNWHPLTWLSHMLDCQLFGLEAWGHHLTNVLLHAANALLLCLLLRKMTGASWRSFMVAALFALHPLRVESVAWIAERKDVLSVFFLLLTLWAYRQYATKADGQDPMLEARMVGSGRRPEADNRSARNQDRRVGAWRDYLLALFLFALGLMSKPMLVTVPFLLLLLDYWPLNRFGTPNPVRSARMPRLLLEKVPFLILAATSSVVTFMVQRHGGAVLNATRLLLGMRVDNALISYSRYLGKVFWPTHLAVFYPMPDTWSLVGVLAAAFLLLSITALVIIQARQRPYLPVGWFWFLGALVPVIGLVQVGWQSMADRYSYLPSIGLFLLLVWGAGDLATRRASPSFARLIAAALVVVLGLLTFRQAGFWKDDETLFGHAVRVTKDNFFAYDLLGLALCAQGHYDRGEIQFQQAVKVRPGYASAHNDWGYALLCQGKLDAAISQFQQAQQLNSQLAEAHKNLAAAFQRKGQVQDAVKEFEAYLRLRPQDEEARNALAGFLLGQGRIDEAIVLLEQALAISPDYAEAHVNLGIALMRKGRFEDGIRHLREAVTIEPAYADAHYNLGVALASHGQKEDAIVQLRAAARLQPDNAAVQQRLLQLTGSAQP